jgi:hypothetical protein
MMFNGLRENLWFKHVESIASNLKHQGIQQMLAVNPPIPGRPGWAA